MDDHVPGDAWTDERLGAAFAALVRTGTPPDLAVMVARRLDERRPRHWLAVPALAATGLVAVLIVGLLVPSLLGRVAGPTGGFTVRDGGPGTKVFDAGEFSFAFPADWEAVDTFAAFSGGSSIAVLGTLPVEARCGERHADVNCVYEQRLEPGTIRAHVGTGAYRTGSILDRPAVDGVTTELTIDGFPARLDERAISPDDVYRADVALELSVARPAGFGQVVTIAIRAREPAVADARAAMDAIVDSFRYSAAAPTLPPDDAGGLEAARRVLTERDRTLRQSIGEGSGETPYSCQPDRPDATAEAELGYDFDSALGGTHPATCSWTLGRDGDRFRVLSVHASWAIGDHPNEATEWLWLDANGAVLGRRLEHRSATPTAPPESAAPVRADGLPHVDSLLGLPVLTVDAALDVLAGRPGDRELVVLGWWPGEPRVECPAPFDAAASPVLPRCPDEFRFLTAEREPLIEVAPGSVTGRPPRGPSLTLHFRDGAQPPAPGFPETGAVEPVPLLVLGHVADHRAVACPGAEREACETAFIVDLALVPGDPPVPAREDRLDAPGTRLEPAGSEDVAVMLARRAAGPPEGDVPPVVALLRLAPDAVAGIEPGLAAPGTGMDPTGVTWLVKLLVPVGDWFHMRTFALRDEELAGDPGTLADGVSVFEPRASGVVTITYGEEGAG